MQNIDELAINFWQSEFSINFSSTKYNEFPDPQILDPIWDRYFPPMLILSDIIKEISFNQGERNSNNITNCIFDYHNRLNNNNMNESQFENEEFYSKYKIVFFQRLQKIIEKLFGDTLTFPHEFYSFNDFIINIYFIIKHNNKSYPQFTVTDTDFLIRFLENLPCSTNFSVFTWGFSSHLYDPKDPKILNIRADIFFEILLKLNRQKHWILSTFLNSSGAIDLFLDQMMPFISNNLNLSSNLNVQSEHLFKKSESLFILIELIFDILIGHYSEVGRFNEILNRLWNKLLFFISHNSSNSNENSDVSLEIHIFRNCVRLLNFIKRKFQLPQFVTFFDSFISACGKSYHLCPLSLQLILYFKQSGISVIKHFRNLFEQADEENSNSISNTTNNNFDDDDDNSTPNDNNNTDDNNPNENNTSQQITLKVDRSIDHNSILFMATYYKENLNNRNENCFQFVQLCMFQAIKDKVLSHTICSLLPPFLIKARNETQWMISFVKHICYFCVFALLKKKYMGRVILIVDLLSAIYSKVMESVQIEISNDAALMLATKRIPFSFICRLNPSPKFDKTVFHDLKVRCNRDTLFSKEILDQKNFKTNFSEPLLFSKLTPRQPQKPQLPHDLKTAAPRKNNNKACPSNISISSANAVSTRVVRPRNRNSYINGTSFSFSPRPTNILNDTNNNNNESNLCMHSIVQNKSRFQQQQQTQQIPQQQHLPIHQFQQVKTQPSSNMIYKSQFNQQRQMIGSNRKSLVQHQFQATPNSASATITNQDGQIADNCLHQTRNGISGKIEPTKPVVKNCSSYIMRGTTQRLVFH